MSENAGKKLFTTAAAAGQFGLDLLKYADTAKWVVTELHLDGALCPHCSAAILQDQRERYFKLEQIRCHGCQRKFTAATGTLLNNSKLEVRELFLIAVLTELGVPAKRIAAQLKLHPDTVANWQAHFQAQQELQKPASVEPAA